MIGMGFVEFLILLVLGLISAAVIHYWIGYRFLTGGDGFVCKWIAGWVGGWVASPVLGHWFDPIMYGHVYIIPALIGAFVGSFMLTASWKAAATAYGLQATTARPYDVSKAA